MSTADFVGAISRQAAGMSVNPLDLLMDLGEGMELAGYVIKADPDTEHTLVVYNPGRDEEIGATLARYGYRFVHEPAHRWFRMLAGTQS